MKKSYIALLTCSILFSNIAKAEKWVSVGDNFFVDLDSQSKKGDIGSVLVKWQGGNSYAEFDCKNKTYIKLPHEIITENSFLEKILKYSCKDWYELWK